MKVLLVGNHTCGNRGDAAILRGLIAALEARLPGAELTVTSRHPISSAYLLGREVEPDLMDRWAQGQRSRLPARLVRVYRRKLVPLLMGLAGRPSLRRLVRLLPGEVRRRIERIGTYDLVVQVGGSFFVDLYGPRQFEVPFAALLAGRPLLLIGHSMGPFGGRFYRLLSRRLLEGARAVALREAVSLKLIEDAGLPLDRVQDGADTAWLVPAPAPATAASEPGRPLIGITLRELAPFDRRLGVSQADYEAAFARLADALIAAGYDIVAASTCTGIEQYRDDRMVALKVRRLVASPERFRVVMDEVTDLNLGTIFQSCRLVVGTRLHSTIIAMNFGTPAIAINYEHKSEGVMAQLGLPEFSTSLAMLIDGRLERLVMQTLGDIDAVRPRVAEAVARERERAGLMVDRCLAAAGLPLAGAKERAA